MAKQHRLANARIEVDTALPVARVIEVARHAADTQRSLKVIGEGESGIRVALNGLLGGALMHFTVTAEAVDGRTHAVSEIEQYRTSQTTVYFVPVGPKSMEGIGIYRRFMATFGQAMQAADPSAQIRMIEREDRPAAVSALADEASALRAPAVSAVPLVPGATEVPAAVSVPAVPAVPVAPAPAVPMPAFENATAPQSGPPPVPQVPTTAPAVAPAAAGVTTPGGVSESTARTVQIVGGVVFAGGLIFWYTTPSNVTVGPIMVIMLGAAIAGVGFLLGRRANSAASDGLAAKLRQERALNAAEAPVADPFEGAAAPVPASLPVVPPLPAAPAGFVPSTPVYALPPMPDPTGAPVAFPAGSIPPVPLPPSAPEAMVPTPPLPPVPQLAVPVVPEPEPEPVASAASVPPQPDVPPMAPIASVPGFVASAPTADAEPSRRSTATATSDDDDLDTTRVAPSAARVGWQVVLPDGRTLPVSSVLRFGRDPIPDPAGSGAVLVPLEDPAKSISKTHAQVQSRGGELIVTDLHSTNGTVIVADGSPIQVAPERPQVVTGDIELRLGDYVLHARRINGVLADRR